MTAPAPSPDRWLAATLETLAGDRRMIDAAVAQLDDAALVRRPAPGANSVAVLLRHLGGNLASRWSDVLTTDGEKSTRDRDREFEDWPGDRASLLAFFDSGWTTLTGALAALGPDDLGRTVHIRGEAHTVPQAIVRSVTHIAYHVGQLVFVARLVHGDDATWKWMTVAPGASSQHNATTWGTASSRSVLGALPPAVRRAVPGDEAAVRDLRLRALADAPDAFSSTLEREHSRTSAEWTRWCTHGGTFLAERDGVAVGLAGGIPHDEHPGAALLVSMWIEPASRGSGAADALVAAVVDWATGAGFAEVHLDVGVHNTRARSLYARHGFTPTGGGFVREQDGLPEIELRRALAPRRDVGATGAP